MAYIRATSNPESLYIWGEKGGRINILHRVKPPFSSPWPDSNGPWIVIPLHIFHGLCKRYFELGEEDVKYRGASVKLVWSNHHRYIQFSYQKHWFQMWACTWECVVANVIRRERINDGSV